MIVMDRLRQLAFVAAVAVVPAACAPQSAGPATAPPTASMSSTPSPTQAAMPAAPGTGGMTGMDHSRMPGMSQAGMDHNAMMAHCAEMRQGMRPGMAMTADMRQSMAQCDQMDRSMGGSATPPARRGR